MPRRGENEEKADGGCVVRCGLYRVYVCVCVAAVSKVVVSLETNHPEKEPSRIKGPLKSGTAEKLKDRLERETNASWVRKGDNKLLETQHTPVLTDKVLFGKYMIPICSPDTSRDSGDPICTG